MLNESGGDAFDSPKAIRSTLSFLVQPKSFAKRAGEHDLALSCKAGDLRRIYLGDKERHLAEFQAHAATKAAEIRRSFWRVGLTIVSTIFTAYLLSTLGSICFGSMPSRLNLLLQAIGAALLLWGTVWQLDPYTKSMAGVLLAERVHGWLFRLLYYFGTLLIMLAYFWPTN